MDNHRGQAWKSRFQRIEVFAGSVVRPGQLKPEILAVVTGGRLWFA